MKRKCNVAAISLGLLIAGSLPQGYGQDAAPLRRSATLDQQSQNLIATFSVEELADHDPMPTLGLTVQNLSKDAIRFPRARLHVAGVNGEPPTTLMQRQMTHTLRPQEREARERGFGPMIEAGDHFKEKYEIKNFYDLSVPGNYTAYLEVLDEAASKTNAGVWVRSNTVSFVVSTAASQ